MNSPHDVCRQASWNTCIIYVYSPHSQNILTTLLVIRRTLFVTMSPQPQFKSACTTHLSFSASEVRILFFFSRSLPRLRNFLTS